MNPQRCRNKCKFRCDFDVEPHVFCHAIGRDLGPVEIKLLEAVGCASWKIVDNKRGLWPNLPR